MSFQAVHYSTDCARWRLEVRLYLEGFTLKVEMRYRMKLNSDGYFRGADHDQVLDGLYLYDDLVAEGG